MPLKRKIADRLVLIASRDIAAAAHSIAAMAEIAEKCAAEGDRDEALQILLDLEPKLHDARKLLELASFASRHVRNRTGT
jgi:hypothetical protein